MTTLDTLLYWYTLTFSVALIFSALNNGLNLNNLTSLAFFLPVPAFLLLQTLKRYYLWRQTTQDDRSQQLTNLKFSPKSFVTQTNPAFIFTFILLVTALLISLIKSFRAL